MKKLFYILLTACLFIFSSCSRQEPVLPTNEPTFSTSATARAAGQGISLSNNGTTSFNAFWTYSGEVSSYEINIFAPNGANIYQATKSTSSFTVPSNLLTQGIIYRIEAQANCSGGASNVGTTYAMRTGGGIVVELDEF